jgi:hypothetical protein
MFNSLCSRFIRISKRMYEKKCRCCFSNNEIIFVTQGRNLCVSGFIESGLTHMLFIDSDILFNAESIFKMIERDKDVISIPYPLKL